MLRVRLPVGAAFQPRYRGFYDFYDFYGFYDLPLTNGY